MPAPQYNRPKELARPVEQTPQDHLDRGMSKRFKRCSICKVPLAVDGHEKVRWCIFSECSNTQVRLNPKPKLEYPHFKE